MKITKDIILLITKPFLCYSQDAVENMRHFYQKHKNKINYIMAGAWNTLFSYVTFIILYYLTKPFKLHIVIVLIFSQIISLTQAYITYKIFVFKTKGNYLQEYFRFYLVYGSSFIINLILILSFVDIMHMNPILSQGIIACIVVILSYFAHTNFSFMEKKKTINE